jgi:hypothetical protein
MRGHQILWPTAATAFFLATISLLGAGSAAAGRTDCTLTANAPASYYGVAVITSGSVDCPAVKNVIRFSCCEEDSTF